MRNYRAFISYNHGDERIAHKLHRRIEAYRPSTRLMPTPRRIQPVFRDREELAAAADLPEKVMAALQNSENLIVICSPRSAKSEWVNREIATFANMHGSERIFPVIAEGEAPGCFPPALLEATPNPLAADLQDGKDGFDNGALKLIAALLPAPFGEVKDREVARTKRRTRIMGGLAGIFALLLIAAVVFGFRAVEETQRANAELTRAEAAILTLVQGIEEIVHQVAAGADSGAVSTGLAATLLATAEGMAESAIAQAPENPALREEYGDLLIQLARHYERAGDVVRSENAAKRARILFDRLAADGGDVLSKIVMATMERGDAALAVGDLNSALGFYQENGDLLREKLQKEPDNDSAQSDLAISLERVGDVRVAQGDLASALAVYEESFTIRRTYSATNPNDADLARNLSVSLEKIGNVRKAQGDFPGALVVYEESLKIARDLYAQDPSNVRFARDVSASLEKVGNVRMAQGDLIVALEVYAESLMIARGLYAQDPDNTRSARNVSILLGKIGRVQMAQDDTLAALSAFEESLKIARDLYAQDPNNARLARDVAISLESVGDVRSAQGDLPGALADYEEALVIARDLSALDPEHAEWARGVWVLLWRMASSREGDTIDIWQEVVARIEDMKARGILLVADEEYLTTARQNLAAARAK